MTQPPNGDPHCCRDHVHSTVWRMMDSMIPTSGPWSLLRQSMPYIINLAPIIWWALPAGLAQPYPEPPNASTYAWFPEKNTESSLVQLQHLESKAACKFERHSGRTSKDMEWVAVTEDNTKI
ncbi:hypothetical protein DSO57_1030000 [Entomophthora muscae]|uniref:Uncharacterized protein n=1 Tax=Entomophthora muscae TaxID=34485 RepID=A0ACC2RS29_9FUNG|nr:hypothetical protein DSO57_1030000 [Entomophthora muscae]